MKFFIFFVLALVAVATAAPQLFTYPALAPLTTGPRTLVAGPAVINGVAYPGRVWPNFYGPAFL